MELDSRRELGLIFRDAQVIRRLVATFELDWNPDEEDSPPAKHLPETDKNMQKAVQIFMRELPPLTNRMKKAVKKVVAVAGQEAFADKKVKQAVKKVVKKAVKEAMKEVAHSIPPQAPAE